MSQENVPDVEVLGGRVLGPPNDMPWGQRVAHTEDWTAAPSISRSRSSGETDGHCSGHDYQSRRLRAGGVRLAPGLVEEGGDVEAYGDGAIFGRAVP
jgi:hypothetical protein